MIQHFRHATAQSQNGFEIRSGESAFVRAEHNGVDCIGSVNTPVLLFVGVDQRDKDIPSIAAGGGGRASIRRSISRSASLYGVLVRTGAIGMAWAQCLFR